MKLYRFTASSTQRAIFFVNDSLGPDALIYSTRKIPGGVEVLAGLPLNIDEPQAENNGLPVEIEKINQPEIKEDNSLAYQMIESFKTQIETMNQTIQSLSNNIACLQKTYIDNVEAKKLATWKVKLASIPKLIKNYRDKITN